MKLKKRREGIRFVFLLRGVISVLTYPITVSSSSIETRTPHLATA
eukprot:CAMPEP_0172487996 /NCGR_PEP_ID=MMETSP1066-20121228/17341_1 /TAXON_ID=671091 /ORGANISM="Coscinodiscus wailesii, Strain CCMP2513" /LENGTH=44 /DNA_ID= /DNA_START= /DNA_END= /DNA_ORIENTATION=